MAPCDVVAFDCKNGISSYEIARDLGVTQRPHGSCLVGFALPCRTKTPAATWWSGIEVEADETFIGGKARNMHPARRNKMRERGNFGKTIVSAVLERHGKVRATVVPNRRKKAIQAHLREHVEPDRSCTAMSFFPMMALMSISTRSSIMPRLM